MTLRSVQDALEVVHQKQQALEKKEAALTEQLIQLRSSGDPPFSFLYWCRDDEDDDDDHGLRSREFRAPNLHVAAKRMALFLDRFSNRHPGVIGIKVDHEAEFKGNYLDLTKLGEEHPIYEYL